MSDPILLTARQQEILDLIEQTLLLRGFPPTRAEIAQQFGFSSANAAQSHLQALQRKGAIAMDGAHRGIQVLSQSTKTTRKKMLGSTASSNHWRVPVVGRVAAGAPILAEQSIEQTLSLDKALFHSGPDYLLRVKGLSMRDAGILDGDLVAVKSQFDARNGQIVVARLDDEATVKRFEKRGNSVRLIAENPDFATIEVDLRRDALVLEGLVIGVLRQFKAKP